MSHSSESNDPYRHFKDYANHNVNGRRKLVKDWDKHDTTNRVNRDQYVKAHFDAVTSSRRGRFDSNGFEDCFSDDRPMRIGIPHQMVGGARRTRHSDDGPQPTTIALGGVGDGHWRSWDIAANATLAKATLEATRGSQDAVAVATSRDGDAASLSNTGVLPRYLSRSVLKMQIPLQHRIVNNFHDLMREGVWAAMVGDGRKLPLRLLNSFVRPIGGSTDQQARLLAYYLYDLRELLTVPQRILLYQICSEIFEGSSPDHLAILLSGKASFTRKEKAAVMACIRDEVRFAGSLPYSLGTAFALSAPLVGGKHVDALAVLKRAPQPSLYPNGTWAALARHAFSETKSLEVVRAIVDAATAVDERHMSNIDLWNAYVEASPIEHATEIVMQNMPKHQVTPTLITLAELCKKCVDGGHWKVALETLNQSAPLAPSPSDPERFQHAYKDIVKGAMATFEKAQRPNEIALLKRLVPSWNAIVRSIVS